MLTSRELPDRPKVTTGEIADWLGVSRDYAHVLLRRNQIPSRGREAGRRGQNLYRRADVIAKLDPDHRPGQGYRTDLHLGEESVQAKYRKAAGDDEKDVG